MEDFTSPLPKLAVAQAGPLQKLVIEIGGGPHHEPCDAVRTQLIEREGYRGLRFWNNDVLCNPEGVLAIVDATLREQHPHLTSPIKGEE